MNAIIKSVAVAAATLASPAMATDIEVVNTNPNFGFKLLSAKVSGDKACMKIGFTKIVLSDSGKLEFFSQNQGVVSKSNFVQEFGANYSESLACNWQIKYQTDDKTSITPTDGRLQGSASIAAGHRVALKSKIASSSKTQPQVSDFESKSAPIRIKIDLSSVAMNKLGGPIPCGTTDTLKMQLNVALKGNSSESSEIRLGSAGEPSEEAERLFSNFSFSTSGC